MFRNNNNSQEFHMLVGNRQSLHLYQSNDFTMAAEHTELTTQDNKLHCK